MNNLIVEVNIVELVGLFLLLILINYSKLVLDIGISCTQSGILSTILRIYYLIDCIVYSDLGPYYMYPLKADLLCIVE